MTMLIIRKQCSLPHHQYGKPTVLITVCYIILSSHIIIAYGYSRPVSTYNWAEAVKLESLSAPDQSAAAPPKALETVEERAEEGETVEDAGEDRAETLAAAEEEEGEPVRSLGQRLVSPR